MRTLRLSFVRTAAVVASTVVSVAPLVVAAADETKPAKVRIVLVGDSTVTDQAGWGLAFAGVLKPGAECVNRARGGASSKSYYDQGHWSKALALKPAYVLIQFGHNDQRGKGPERETLPESTYREHLRRYVDEARKAGAEPVLVTSLVRRNFDKDGKTLRPDLEPYAEAVRAVAKEKKTPLVDLHARSKAQVESLGPEKARQFGPSHPTNPAAFDNTHLTKTGAEATAPLVADALRDAVPALKEFLPPTSQAAAP